MERTNFEKRINLWSNTLKNKSDSLRYIFGITTVVAMVVFTSVLAFSEYTLKDVTIVLLLLYSLIGCVPYIEVAQVKNDDSFFTKRLTFLNWKEEIRKNGEYNILSSNLNILNSVFPVVTITCFILFFAYKIFGENYVNSNTILIILLVQTPFNTALGLNPLGVSIMRQNISKHVTQNDLKKYLGVNNKKSNLFSIPIRKTNRGTPIVNIVNSKISSDISKGRMNTRINSPRTMNAMYKTIPQNTRFPKAI
jgi:hypothetical protein